MSETANWSYTNTATVWPLLEVGDGWGDPQVGFGEPYQIACTWVGGGERMVNNDGLEFAPSYRYFHEDKRVKYGDWIARGVQTDRLRGEQIKAHTEYDMSPFDEQPDFLSAT